MKTAPKIIFLQQEENPEIQGFINETTWCAHKIHESDIKYIRFDEFSKLTKQPLRETEQ